MLGVILPCCTVVLSIHVCDFSSLGGYYLVTGGTDHVIRVYKMHPIPVPEPWELSGHTVSRSFLCYRCYNILLVLLDMMLVRPYCVM